MADHIEYVASVAGRHRVGLGADYNGIDKVPEGLEDVSTYPGLIAELIRRGWSDEEVVGLAGKNLLRVWRLVELVGEQLSKEELPRESKMDDQQDEY